MKAARALLGWSQRQLAEASGVSAPTIKARGLTQLVACVSHTIDAIDQRADSQVMASVSRFLTNKLRLKVNEAKSAVARPEERKFLGFSISNDGSERRIAPKALDKLKGQIVGAAFAAFALLDPGYQSGAGTAAPIAGLPLGQAPIGCGSNLAICDAPN